MKTKSILFYLMLCLFISQNTRATNIYVNDNSTAGDVYCTAVGNNTNSGLSPSSPKSTLSAALGIATTGDTIFIDSGNYNDINLTVSVLSLTIKGAGASKTIFDNAGASSNTNLLMTITSDNVTIEGIGITGYNNGVSSGAAAISINGANNFLIKDTNVYKNRLPAGATASIVITGASTGTFSGGGSNCNPSGASVGGGGIEIKGAGNNVTFENYSFSGNLEGLVPGAGLSIKGGGTSITTINNSIFDSNEYTGGVGGGALYVYSGIVNISGCKFLNNKCNNTGGGRSYGGAILVDSGSNVTIDNSVFKSNQAVTSGSGGAIAVYTATSPGTGSTVSITKTTFESNTGAQGNHLYTKTVSTRTAVINASNCTFVTNTSNSIYVASGSIIIANSGNVIGGGTLTNTIAPSSAANPTSITFDPLACSSIASCPASLSYSNSTVCNTAATQTPTFSPTGGTFTSTTGLTINATTGVITTSTSTAGSYTITYTPSSADPTCTATFNITIVAAPNAGTNGTLSICAGTTVTATQLFGALGGSPATSGTWTPTLAGAGTYTYSVAATSPCTAPATATVIVTAQAAPVAGTNGTLSICAGTTVTATQLFGALGGSPATGGTWTPALAGAGTYTYSVAATSPCTTPATATVIVSDTQPTQPTATNCWDNYQFNTTSCTWINNGTQPTQPTATNCWDNYQFNTTSCTWINNGTQPVQPTATNCWDNYQFNTTSCTWVNNGTQPVQPTATNCWDNYQFNTTSCTWINNGTQPVQPTATNCWDNYQFNTISCTWVNNGTQPVQPTATNCWDNYQFNTTSCTWVNNGTQPTQPLITVNNAVCNGSTYSVVFNSNGSVTASSGTISGNTVSGIAVGTNVILTATSSNGCATTTMTVASPASCTNPPTDCIVPTLSAGQGTCSGTGTYSFAFNASAGAVVTASSGTISGNTVTGIAVGTNVTLTATNGACVTSMIVNSPVDCNTPCATPMASFSAGICNGATYNINISNPNNATITASAGTVTATAITNIPKGTSVTITSTIAGCNPQIITIAAPNMVAPLITVNNAVCNGSTYSVVFNSNGSVTASSGTISGNTVSGIAVGTNVVLTATSSNGCATTTMTVDSPLNCVTPRSCVIPTLSAGQGICNGAGTYSFAFNVSDNGEITTSAGTISGNSIVGIAIGTNVTLTATDGFCSRSLQVTSPADCSTPCATPQASFSAGICNGVTYTINYINPNNATISATAGTLNATSISNIPVGTNVTITVQVAGCGTQILTISSPLLAVTPYAGNDGSLSICENATPTTTELFTALGGTPQTGGYWTNTGNVYTYTVDANSACSSIPFDTAIVTLNKIIITDFVINGGCVNENYQLSVNPIQTGVTYSWYDSTDSLKGTGTSLVIDDNGTYKVIATLTGCEKSVSITIDNSHCIIPKGLSPNGDGLNDEWDLSNLNVEKAQIFNRYGMEMFGKSNYTNQWHGQSDKGHELPSATYYYVLTFSDGQVKTGWVYLNREN